MGWWSRQGTAVLEAEIAVATNREIANRVVREFLSKYGISIRPYSVLNDKTWFSGPTNCRISFKESVIEHFVETPEPEDLLHEGVHLILGPDRVWDNEGHVLMPFEWSVAEYLASLMPGPVREEFVGYCDTYQTSTSIYGWKNEYRQLRHHDRGAAFWQNGIQLALRMGILGPDLIPTFQRPVVSSSTKKLLAPKHITQPDQTLMEFTMNLVPAYGRDYKSKKEVEIALQQGIDFQIQDISSDHNGRYINLPQLKEAKIRSVNIRYKRLTQVCVLSVEKYEVSK
jgi:hypothetical protein